MAIVDTIIYTKLDGQSVRVGDVGKSVIRALPAGASTAEDLEDHFLYMVDPPIEVSGSSEITNIQVEPSANKEPADMLAGGAIVYGTGDLL